MPKPTRRDVVKGVAALAAAPLFLRREPARAAAFKTHIVDIKDFAFAPAKLDVCTGDTIIWINRDIAPHTATALNETWGTGTLEQDQKHSLIVTKDMTTQYFCRHHPAMKGVLNICDSGS